MVESLGVSVNWEGDIVRCTVTYRGVFCRLNKHLDGTEDWWRGPEPGGTTYPLMPTVVELEMRSAADNAIRNRGSG
jgi:hypothetical protein